MCGADDLFPVKANAPDTFHLLARIDWEKDATGHFEEELDKLPGGPEPRSIRVPPPRRVHYPGVRQITRCREPLREDGDRAGEEHMETAHVLTSLDAAAASPKDRLRLNRGHGVVENRNHRRRDCVFGEDACLTGIGHGPANRARLDRIALAVIFTHRRDSESFAETRRRLQLDHSQAFAAVTRP